ncbi:Peptidase inhibitor 16 [Lamellibrachia satsuma]|nr:Peptidase inhibitor 16 [Lamellibrachia satsuma]
MTDHKPARASEKVDAARAMVAHKPGLASEKVDAARAMMAHNPGRASEKIDATRAMTMVARTLAASSGSNVAEHLKVSGEMRNLIVDLHNQHRATVMPPATDMETMQWDDDVAQYAAEWAQCGEYFFQHREGANRNRSYGENLYISMSSGEDPVNVTDEIKNGLNAWWREKDDYDFRSNSCEAGKKCGHYTQMAWAKSNVVGCGYARNCPIEGKPQYTSSFYLVCNYSPAGNFNGMKPYTVEQTKWTSHLDIRWNRERCKLPVSLHT